jgi:hypothetical protein
MNYPAVLKVFGTAGYLKPSLPLKGEGRTGNPEAELRGIL